LTLNSLLYLQNAKALLDKSPELVLDDNLILIQNEFGQKNPNIILCSEPFDKAEFLNLLINSVKIPIIFVDMDLLYTGYIESKMIQKKENVEIICPNKTNWKEKLSEIISRISKERCWVVIDSLNGIYNSFDNLEYARSINSSIMLLSDIGYQTRSPIIITTMARKKENDEWVLLPGGKHIVKSEKTGVYFLKKNMNDLVINTIEKTDTNSKKFSTEQR
jgi:hypothetical protein